MKDQYFGIKELYEVVLKAKTPMQFGSRRLEAEEAVLYFEKVNIATLSETSSPVMARGGWLNMPQVIWEDRSEVQFVLSEGVISSVSLGILLSSDVTEKKKDEPLLVPKREGPRYPEMENEIPYLILEHEIMTYPTKKVFIYEYENGVAQKKIYGKKVFVPKTDIFTGIEAQIQHIQLYEDKDCQIPADATKQYIIDYYYEYMEEALLYTINKERFNGLFTLEGKFYSKDENDGKNYTNLIYMPKVRVVSDINLRLGERADPSTSVFNIIGLPETLTNNRNGLIVEITRLNDDIDGDS